MQFIVPLTYEHRCQNPKTKYLQTEYHKPQKKPIQLCKTEWNVRMQDLVSIRKSITVIHYIKRLKAI